MRGFVRAVIAVLSFLATAPVIAATLSVNSAADPGDGTCNATECTLREAINVANTIAGVDTINFAIPGAGPHTIAIATELPAISEMIINGYSQPGATPNSNSPAQGGSNAQIKIVVRGSSCTDCNGFVLGTPPLSISGLAIGGFPRDAIGEPGFSSHPDPASLIIRGNFIGLEPDGITLITPSVNAGIRIGRAATIGGATPFARNVIAGYTGGGITTNYTGVILEGNLIGTDATGLRHFVAADGVSGNAVTISGTNITAPPVRVGGPALGQRNVLIGIGNAALNLSCQSLPLDCQDGAVVQGNYINVDASERPVPVLGLRTGISVRPPGNTRLTIGGLAAGEANSIGLTSNTNLYASAAGLAPHGIASWAGNRFIRIDPARRQPIRMSAGGGIGASGLPNDPDDADDGPNRLLNTPEIIDVVGVSDYGDGVGTITIRYRVDATPTNADYPLRIDFNRVGTTAGDVTSITGVIGAETYSAANAQQIVTVVYEANGADRLPFMAMTTDASGRSSEFNPQIFGDGVFSDAYEDPL